MGKERKNLAESISRAKTTQNIVSIKYQSAH